MQIVNNVQINGWSCFFKHDAAHFTVLKHFSSGCYAAIQNHSSLWLGRAPQHPLSRPSSFHGVEESFRFDVMQIVNNLQINGWSCSPKHDRAHFTELKHFLVWMLLGFSKTIKFMAGPCSPKHGPVSFTVLNNFFCLDVTQPFKNHSNLWLGRAPQHPLSRPS